MAAVNMIPPPSLHLSSRSSALCWVTSSALKITLKCIFRKQRKFAFWTCDKEYLNRVSNKSVGDRLTNLYLPWAEKHPCFGWSHYHTCGQSTVFDAEEKSGCGVCPEDQLSLGQKVKETKEDKWSWQPIGLTDTLGDFMWGAKLNSSFCFLFLLLLLCSLYCSSIWFYSSSSIFPVVLLLLFLSYNLYTS